MIDECSGVRYLMASFMVGTLFAYLNYRSYRRRALFMLLSLLVPVVANWVRAYLIVMMAHLSGNRIATGVDHIIYGWVFFGLIIFLMFWVGSFWRDDRTPPRGEPRRRFARAALASLGRLAGCGRGGGGRRGRWPLYAAHLDRAASGGATVRLELPSPRRGWSLVADAATNWRPNYDGASASFFQIYRKGDRTSCSTSAIYPNQRRGAEARHLPRTSWSCRSIRSGPTSAESRRKEDSAAGRWTSGRRCSGRPEQRLAGLGLVPHFGTRADQPVPREAALRARQAAGSRRRRAAIIVAIPYDGEPEVGRGHAARVRARDDAVDRRGAGRGREPRRHAGALSRADGIRMTAPPPLIVHVVFRFGIGGLENGIVNLINRMPARRGGMRSWR